MSRALYPYFDRELSFMRDMGGEFARNYPDVAARLNLERHRCDDPHVERLIEAFCLVAARIHHRLDADAPEISQALLNLVYPHYLRPTPSMSIVQFRLASSERTRQERITVKPRTEIHIGEDLCQFRTCYPVDLWPIEVAHAAILDVGDLPSWARSQRTSAAIVLRLSSGHGFSGLKDLTSLRFYLSGPGHIPYTLYELISNSCHGVLFRNPELRDPPLSAPASCIRTVGLAPADGVLPYDDRSFVGLRLLHEYFSFPNKFLFFDLGDLSRIEGAGFGRNLEIIFLLDRETRKSDEFFAARVGASAETFLLGCTPVVNLFPHVAEQIRLDQTKAEYQVIPDNDRTKSLEIFSIDNVVSRDGRSWTKRSYEPFFSFRHTHMPEGNALFWNAVRRPSLRGAGTEVFLSVVDAGFRPAEPADEALDIRVTCTNRNLPAQLALALTFGEVQISDSRVETRFVHRPTLTLSPPIERDLEWRVISMLGLNYLSLSDGGASESGSGAKALQELLSLYNFTDDPSTSSRIRAVKRVASHASRARITFSREGATVPVFCHGLGVEMTIDAETFGRSGMFLFAAVLEQFFALYRSVNSFSQLTATLEAADPRRRAVWQWPPRTGERRPL